MFNSAFQARLQLVSTGFCFSQTPGGFYNNMRPSLVRVTWFIVSIILITDAVLYLRTHTDRKYKKRPTVLKQNFSSPGLKENTPGSGNATLSLPCVSGIPGCRYPDEVDLRVIVLTHKRTTSLLKLLKSLDDLELDGDNASLEIWIDRSKDGKVDETTVSAATEFGWSRGPSRVHVRDTHAGIYGQWIDTWRPVPGTKELALILEDDLSVSPYAYRWVRAAHNKYGGRKDIAGYTLQSEGVNIATSGAPVKGPKDQPVFLYQLLGSWGYVPHPDRWWEFQDWYHEVSKEKSFKPYVPGLRMTRWYTSLEKKGKADSMWTMWHIYYCEKHNLYTAYSSLGGFTASRQSCLSVNRKEPGLHFQAKGPENMKCLIEKWKDSFARFPERPVKFKFNGKE